MSSLEDLRNEIALITKELASLETPKFHGQKEEFPYWISKVEQVFTRHNLDEHEMFKAVVKKLRGHALEWWENNKYKRKKRGKSKIKTWEKLRGKLEYAFAPPSYLHKHLFLPFEENCLNSSSKDIPFNKGSPMSTCIPNSTYLFCLEEPNGTLCIFFTYFITFRKHFWYLFPHLNGDLVQVVKDMNGLLASQVQHHHHSHQNWEGGQVGLRFPPQGSFHPCWDWVLPNKRGK